MGRKGKGITACRAEGRRGKVMGAVVAALALSLLTVLPVQAATVVVAIPTDSGPGSLRWAIATAKPGDTIMFSVRGTIPLTSGALVLNKDLTIAGPGAALAPELLITFYLRPTGGDVLDEEPPTATTPTSNDAPGLNFKNRNPWQTIGT